MQKIIIYIFAYSMGSLVGNAQANPFLKPGSNRPLPPVIQKPTPPPPKPIPRNPNLEFRGYYEFQGVWKLALFDKVKNQGFWLTKGEVIDGIEVEIESFNLETEEIKLKGGMTLSLKESDKSIIPVPSGQVSSKSSPPIPSQPGKPVVPVNRIPPPRTR